MVKEDFAEELKVAKSPISFVRNTLRQERERLHNAFNHGEPVTDLVAAHSHFIDELLRCLWHFYQLDTNHNICLLAVGGYGRQELHPHSDIDLLILHKDALSQHEQTSLEKFTNLLWDIGLHIAHTVRDIEECVSQARQDITVITALIDARLLVGSQTLYQTLTPAIDNQHLWSSAGFYCAKMEELHTRHKKYTDTSYNLEPNIKVGPGGLRDIHTVFWIAKRHFNCESLHELVAQDIITENEYLTLKHGQEYLWKLRFALHFLTDRQEERLLFDHQVSLAKHFGYQDKPGHLAIEQFMKAYYRTVREINFLNDTLLQLFREIIFHTDANKPLSIINEHFQLNNGYLEARQKDLFKQVPSAMLEVFLLLAKDPNIKGVKASTIRLLRRYRYLINDEFCQSKTNQALFLQLFRQRGNIALQFQRMNRYGILARYLSPFGNIVGQMQYDLFHIFTVDQHLLFTLRNIYHFAHPQEGESFPLCEKLIKKIDKLELLYLAALFHDISKGQGGDHSDLGSDEVLNFCQTHNLPEADTQLLAWLVKYHLLMSTTAQRKDIYDPEVIHEFAAAIDEPHYLDYLYMLTVADIRATNPSLWNSWKDSLLSTLYNRTTEWWGLQQEAAAQKAAIINNVQQHTITLLEQDGIEHDAITQLWPNWESHYFLRNTSEDIAWHTRHMVGYEDKENPLILINPKVKQGGTEIFIYTSNLDYVFANTTAILDRLRLNIAEAQILTTNNDFIIESYIVINKEGTAITDEAQLASLKKTLENKLKPGIKAPQPAKRLMSRRLQHFTYPTSVTFSQDKKRNRTIMEVISPDRPGLLARIGMVFVRCEIHLQNAKIATMGERVEDMFFITDKEGNAITTEEAQEELRTAICKLLDKKPLLA